MVFSFPAKSAIDAACDPGFLASLKVRAWMEAQREVMNNQKMIWKPDSVLALGCYATWLDVMGDSFTKDSGQGLVKTLEQAQKYLEASFNHGLGGGSLGFTTPPLPTDCSNMDKLWMAAKCKNLELNDFMSINELGLPGATDVRQFPKACTGMGNIWATGASIMSTAGLGLGYDKMELFTSITGSKSENNGSCTTTKLLGGTYCNNAGCAVDAGTCK